MTRRCQYLRSIEGAKGKIEIDRFIRDQDEFGPRLRVLPLSTRLSEEVSDTYNAVVSPKSAAVDATVHSINIMTRVTT